MLMQGPPSAHLPTGTAVYLSQSAALRFTSYVNAKFLSAQIYLNTLHLSSGFSVYLSLCQEKGDVPDESKCIESGILEIINRKKQLLATWNSKTNPLMKMNETYWLILRGDAPIVDESLSWLDANDFKGTTAFQLDDGKWINEGYRSGASSLILKVS